MPAIKTQSSLLTMSERATHPPVMGNKSILVGRKTNESQMGEDERPSKPSASVDILRCLISYQDTSSKSSVQSFRILDIGNATQQSIVGRSLLQNLPEGYCLLGRQVSLC